MKGMPKIQPRRPYFDGQPEGMLESDCDYVLNNIEAAVRLLDTAQTLGHGETPVEYQELESHQWGGLARDLIMCLDMNCRRGDEMHTHLERLGRPIPEWLAEYIPNEPHCPSKGNMVCAIVRAALTAQRD